MATVYLNLNAVNNGDGTTSSAAASNGAEGAFNSSSSAESGAGADGTIIITANTAQDGNDWQGGYIDFEQNLTIEAEARRTVRLQDGSVGSYGVRFSDPWSTTARLSGFIVDGATPSKGAAIQIENVATAGAIVQIHDCELIAGSNYSMLWRAESGRLEMVNCKLSGAAPSSGITGGSAVSNVGDQAADIQGIDMAFDLISGTSTIINLQQENSPTNAFNVAVGGITGTIECASSSSVTACRIDSKDSINVSNSNFTMNGDAVSSVSGILVRGKGSGVETSDANVTNNQINYNCNAGYGIQYGQSQTDAHVTGGIVSGNTVVGKYFDSGSPHNIMMGQGTGGDCKGNVSTDSFVGILLSVTDSCNCLGNTIFDCYGSSLYVKGATAATLKNNICVVTNKYTQRSLGILAVAAQGATDTTSADFEENLIIVQDVDAIYALAHIDDASQTCTFTRNTYIIPDTVDLSTAELFNYKNGGSGTNDTYADWLARAEVTDDVIVQVDASEMSRLVELYRPATSGGSGTTGIISNVIK